MIAGIGDTQHQHDGVVTVFIQSLKSEETTTMA
jgi:hypothetical protein